MQKSNRKNSAAASPKHVTISPDEVLVETPTKGNQAPTEVDSKTLLQRDDEQKYAALGVLHTVMCHKIEAAKAAIKAWGTKRDELGYLDQPVIPAVLQYGPK